MTMKEREKMVKAMEFIVRQINNENIFMSWLSVGVADGDINYGDLDTSEHDENLEYYTEDDNFKDLMSLFLRLMVRAWKSGGLYCDNVVSQDRSELEKKIYANDISFITDKEKMVDYFILSKQEFLASYSYLDEEEYDATTNRIREIFYNR